MTTTDTHDYDAIQAAQIEAARILTHESEINVRCDDDLDLNISMTPLRDGEMPRDGEYFWWSPRGAGYKGEPPEGFGLLDENGELVQGRSGPYVPPEKWFGVHMVPTSEEWKNEWYSEGGDISDYCCTLFTDLDGGSTDPRAIARALERSYRDFCARRAAGDRHSDAWWTEAFWREYSSLTD
jgi:hypothetical protein